MVEENNEAMSGLGFEVAQFGSTTYALKAAPAGLRDGEALPAVKEMLAELAQSDQSRAGSERIDTMLSTIACHSVVRAGDVLSDDEARALLRDLDGVDFGAHNPHGRPVLLRIGIGEIARRFGR